MVDWPDLATLRDGIKTATDLASLAKLLDSLRKRMASMGGGMSTRKRLDDLVGAVKNMLDIMQAMNNHQADTNIKILDLMAVLNHRIGELEKAAKKKPRKPVKRKRRA